MTEEDGGVNAKAVVGPSVLVVQVNASRNTGRFRNKDCVRNIIDRRPTEIVYVMNVESCVSCQAQKNVVPLCEYVCTVYGKILIPTVR